VFGDDEVEDLEEVGEGGPLRGCWVEMVEGFISIDRLV